MEGLPSTGVLTRVGSLVGVVDMMCEHWKLGILGSDFVVLLNIWLFSRSGGGIVFFEKFWGMQVLVIDPQVVGVWIIFPVYEVLKSPSSPFAPGVADEFNFVFFLVANQVRWWPHVCWSVCLHLLIWEEEIDVKDIVDFH
jgi:hypothetical protein